MQFSPAENAEKPLLAAIRTGAARWDCGMARPVHTVGVRRDLRGAGLRAMGRSDARCQ